MPKSAIRIIAAVAALAGNLGRTAGATETLDTAQLGDRGVTFEAPHGLQRGIREVVGVGDVDRDGFDDALLIVGISASGGTVVPHLPVLVYGRPGLEGLQRPSEIPRTTTFPTVTDLEFPSAYADACGDVNGDGFADFFVAYGSFPTEGNDRGGAAFLMFGSRNLEPEVLVELVVSEGSGVAFSCSDPTYRGIGHSAANLGDFDGDGRADLTFGVPIADPDGRGRDRGAVFIVSDARAQRGIVDLAAVGGAVPGSRIWGRWDPFGEGIGDSVAPAGDFDGDGLRDLLIHPNNSDPGGAVYLMFGNREGRPHIDLQDDEERASLVTFRGRDTGTSLSMLHAAGLGDVNGDGRDDVLLGYSGVCCGAFNPSAGELYLVYGVPGLRGEVRLESMPAETRTRMIGLNVGDHFGFSVAAAGDLDRDGVPDMLVGATRAQRQGLDDVGEAYAIFGKRDFPSEVALATGFDGVRLLGPEQNAGLGWGLSALGDFDADGLPDFSVSNYGYSGAPGRAYLIYGRQPDAMPVGVLEVDPSWGGLRGGDRVLIRGSGFADALKVKFGAHEATGVTVLSGFEIRAATPPGDALGLVDVSVAAGGSDAKLGGAFEYTPNYPRIDLGDLEGAGFVLEGDSTRIFSWPAISAIDFGDLDGDGLDELVAAAADPPSGWIVAVLPGAPRLPATLTAFGPDKDAASIRDGERRSAPGCTVAVLGDVNGDGLDDLGIGAADGIAWILFGRSELTQDIDLFAEMFDRNSVRILDSRAETTFYRVFCPLGDVTGDGLDDFALSYPGAPLGEDDTWNPGPAGGDVLLVRGMERWSEEIDTADWTDAPEWFVTRVHGSRPRQRLGEKLGRVGDANGDGIADLLIATVASMHVGGSAFLLLGDEGRSGSWDIDGLVEGGGAVEFNLVDGFDHFDWMNVSGAGDADGDGLGDLLFGVEGGGQYATMGLTYLVHGRREWADRITLEENPLQPDGFVRIEGPGVYNQAGRVGRAGDFDGDGLADFLIGAPGYTKPGGDVGHAYLIFGAADPPDSIALRALGGRGLRIDGRSIRGGAGAFVGPDGDFNGDGRTDFAFTEWWGMGGEPTRVYVILGSEAEVLFARGDGNSDGRLDLSDAVFVLSYLFLGGPEPGCKDAADADDSGEVEVTDPIYLLQHLFLGGPEPPAPYPERGEDPTADGLSCRWAGG